MKVRLIIASSLLLLFAACGTPPPASTATASPTLTPSSTTIPPSFAPTLIPASSTPSALAIPKSVMLLTGDEKLFNGPTGIVLDADENMYVVDAGNNRVVKFDATGKPLSTFGAKGSGDGQFSFISENTGYIVHDAHNNIYIADPDNARIDKFDSDGKFLQAWEINSDAEKLHPAFLTIDPNDNLYVIAYDAAGKAFPRKYTLDGKLIAELGSKDSGITWQGPLAITTDANGHVYIPDIVGIIYTFDADGKLLDKFSLPPVNNLFTTPTGIVRDAHGNFYITDGPNNRVIEVDDKGKLLRAFGKQGTGKGDLFRPYGIAFDSHGRLYVVENVNSRVQIFSVE